MLLTVSRVWMHLMWPVDDYLVGSLYFRLYFAKEQGTS